MLKDSGGQDGKIVQKEFEDQAWGNNVQDSLPFSLCGQDLYDDLWDEMAQAYASNLELPMWVNPHSWFCSPSKASPKEGSQASAISPTSENKASKEREDVSPKAKPKEKVWSRSV
eukprot:g9968.t1